MRELPTRCYRCHSSYRPVLPLVRVDRMEEVKYFYCAFCADPIRWADTQNILLWS